MKHPVAWQTPSPLWRDALADSDRTRFDRPEVLRFDADTFMDDMQDALDRAALLDFVTRNETGERPDVGWRPATATDVAPAFDPDTPLKLYLPAHQRFYLVASSLVCRVRGMPDRKVDAANGESASFVVRRLVEETVDGTPRTVEYGWFGDGGWKTPDADTVDIASPDGTVAREERLPMFPVRYGENGSTRRVLAGFVPVGNREAYEGAPRDPVAAAPDDDLADRRQMEFDTLIDTFTAFRDALKLQFDASGDDDADAAEHDMFALALLDLARFLRDRLTEVWPSILAGAWTGSDASQLNVFNALHAVTIGGGPTWNDALVEVVDLEDDILAGARDDAEPLALAIDALARSDMRLAIEALLGIDDSADDGEAGAEPSSFIDGIEAFFAANPYTASDADLALLPAPADSRDGGSYILRCVYDRPRCAPFESAVVSPPSHAFTLASFYDPLAPRRPSRITMPDTSMAGLRQATKSVNVVIGKKLREQIARLQNSDFSDPADPDIAEPQGFELGMICTLSIPIIMICALILLIILVSLLNIVFFWIPFFKICLPINLKEST